MRPSPLPFPALPHRLLAAGGALVDRAALRLMEAMVLSGGDPNAPEAVVRHESARRLYADPGLHRAPASFFPAPCVPEVEVVRRQRTRAWTAELLRWPSGYRCFDPEWQAELDRHDANGHAWAEWLRHEGAGHPVAVCIHSWASGWFRLQRTVFAAASLYRAGIDVLLFMLPFHGPRTPAGSLFGGQLFPGTVPHRINEGMGQTIWDLRGLLAWLRARGAGPIGAMGMSLGGYATSLLACLEPELAFAVPIVPAVSLADLFWMHGAGRPARRAAEQRGITLEALREVLAVCSPLRHRPAVPREGRLIVAGVGDRICPPEHVLALWEHWERPRIEWFPGSHIAQFGRRRVFQAVRDFALERFAAAPVSAAPPTPGARGERPRRRAAPREESTGSTGT